MYDSMHTLVPNQISIYHGTFLQKVNVWSQKMLVHRSMVLKRGMRTVYGSNLQPFSYSNPFCNTI